MRIGSTWKTSCYQRKKYRLFCTLSALGGWFSSHKLRAEGLCKPACLYTHSELSRLAWEDALTCTSLQQHARSSPACLPLQLQQQVTKGLWSCTGTLPDGMGAEKRKDEIHPWEGHLIWPFISAYLKRCPVDSDIFQTIGRFMMTRTNCIV